MFLDVSTWAKEATNPFVTEATTAATSRTSVTAGPLPVMTRTTEAPKLFRDQSDARSKQHDDETETSSQEPTTSRIDSVQQGNGAGGSTGGRHGPAGGSVLDTISSEGGVATTEREHDSTLHPVRESATASRVTGDGQDVDGRSSNVTNADDKTPLGHGYVGSRADDGRSSDGDVTEDAADDQQQPATTHTVSEDESREPAPAGFSLETQAPPSATISTSATESAPDASTVAPSSTTVRRPKIGFTVHNLDFGLPGGTPRPFIRTSPMPPEREEERVGDLSNGQSEVQQTTGVTLGFQTHSCSSIVRFQFL